MNMMDCTVVLMGDGRLHIGLPKSLFETAVQDLKDHTNAKVWIPTSSVIEVRDLVIEFRLKQGVCL